MPAEYVALQCGHDPKAVENDLDDKGNKLPDGASMRPRPEGRGERHGASGVLKRGLSPMLQCGHDPKAVENG